MEHTIIGKWLKKVNFKLGNESKKWTDQHDMSVEQRKTLNPWQQIELMTSWTPDGRSIHWATRTYGEQAGYLTEFMCELNRLYTIMLLLAVAKEANLV